MNDSDNFIDPGLTIFELASILKSSRGRDSAPSVPALSPACNHSRTPTRYSLLKRSDPLARITAYDCVISVFAEGYAIYEIPGHYTVFDIDQISDILSDECVILPGRTFPLSDLPWPTAVMLAGQCRIEKNLKKEAKRREIHYSEPVAAKGDDLPVTLEQTFMSDESIENNYILRESFEQLLSPLNARQHEVMELYYKSRLSQENIASILDIKRTNVAKIIQRSKETISRSLDGL